MVTAGSELTPGILVDRRYRIQCTLGRGGFGRTYLVADERRFNELCVLKEFVPSSQVDPVIAQKLRELFQREAAILHKLNHPQIPKFFAGFEENQRLFIAQEYINGKTYWRLLQERQRRGYAFSQREIVEWLRDLLKVLDYLHSQNIVHRDISPDNIMLPRGHKLPVLIDFGVVKQVFPHLPAVNPHDADLVQASVSVGKFGYAPYEQIRMGQCSPRSDLYALAVTAVVLLTGKPPNLLIDSKSLEWQWKRWLHLDARLTQILDRMIAERPQDRFTSAQAVLQALQPLCESLDAPPQGDELQQTVQQTAKQLLSQPVKRLAANQPFASRAKAVRDIALIQKTTDLQPAEPQLAPDEVIQPTLARELRLSQAIERTPAASLLHEQDSTSIEAITPTQSTQWATILEPRLSLLTWLRGAVLRLPQDQLGNAPDPLRLSVRQILVLSILAFLPLAGIGVGVRSPHIMPLCGVLKNCAGSQTPEQRYQLAIQQANSATVLTDQARSLDDLQNARKQLADSISQLNTFTGSAQAYGTAQHLLPKYETLLVSLDRTLEKEMRSTELLNRAEAEAQKAMEQTRLAKTARQYQTAQTEWRRALATLSAIPDNSFASRQAAVRTQEYKARLDATTLKVAGLPPEPKATAAAPSFTRLLLPVVLLEQPLSGETDSASTSNASANNSPATSASANTASPALTARPAASPPATTAQSATAQPVAPRKSRSVQPAQRANASSARRSASSRSVVIRPAAPRTSQLEVNSHWMAGSVTTSATQTLQDVSIWIDGTRTETDGKFVANLWIQNRSRQGFGFVPLYAESRDSDGNPLRSRVLFTGATSTMLEPGKALMGQIYLLDRPASVQALTLVIQESTSGNRTFRIPF